MAGPTNRVNVALDQEHVLKLRRLAERTHTNPGTIARSLLMTALDEADPDARHVTALLDGIPGAFERADRGRQEADAGLGTPLALDRVAIATVQDARSSRAATATR